MADGAGLPISICIDEGPRHETKLVDKALDARFTRKVPTRLIGDKAYDSTNLQKRLKQRHVQLIAPMITPKQGHQTHPTRRHQDRRPLRRYRRRWKVERLWAWLLRYRKITTRYECKAENFLGFLHLACAVILTKRLADL